MTKSKSSKSAVAAGFTLPRAPQRTNVADEVADRFVGDKPQTRGKRKGAGERLTIYIPPEVAEALRVACARERRSLSEAVTEALHLWISGHVHK